MIFFTLMLGFIFLVSKVSKSSVIQAIYKTTLDLCIFVSVYFTLTISAQTNYFCWSFSTCLIKSGQALFKLYEQTPTFKSGSSDKPTPIHHSHCKVKVDASIKCSYGLV